MKKIILFAAAAAMLLVGCQNAKTYAVTGEVEGLEGTVALIPMSGNADEPYGEAEVVDGKFAIDVFTGRKYNIESTHPGSLKFDRNHCAP